MKKNRLMTWLMIFALAAATLAACGSQQSEEPAPATEEPATEAPAPETQEPAADNSGEITADKAKEVALADAGVDASAAVFKKADLDFDDGVKKFEVEFFANDKEYSYDIDASNGNILSKESEAMDAEDYQEMEALK